MTKANLISTRLKMPGDEESIFELMYNKGWTDGLPIVPPTEERVWRMVEHVGRDPSEVIAYLVPKGGAATIEKIAVNAVMAGCLPEYMPVIVAAVEAMAEPEFNLDGVQCTTSPVTPLLVINGPVRNHIGINCGRGALGPGWRANATIGRAVRFILVNIGGAKPGTVSQATLGWPGRYTLCLGEDEEGSAWEPLHVERGFDREQSAVTVIGVQGITNNFTPYKKAESMLTVIADSMAQIGSTTVLASDGNPVVILTAAHSRLFSEHGYSKEAVKKELFERAKVPKDRFPDEHTNVNCERSQVWDGNRLLAARDAKDILIVVSGGPAPYHASHCPGWGHTWAVTKPIPPTNSGTGST